MKRLDNEERKTIPYRAGVPALEDYYARQFDLIKKGNTDLVTLELVMLGRALDFVRFAKTRLGVELRTDEASVQALEEVLDALERGVVQDSLFPEGSGGPAAGAAAYLGVLMLANIGGRWDDTESGAAVNINGRPAYVGEYMERRLLGLSALSAVTYYQSVKPAGTSAGN